MSLLWPALILHLLLVGSRSKLKQYKLRLLHPVGGVWFGNNCMAFVVSCEVSYQPQSPICAQKWFKVTTLCLVCELILYFSKLLTAKTERKEMIISLPTNFLNILVTSIAVLSAVLLCGQPSSSQKYWKLLLCRIHPKLIFQCTVVLV